MALKNQVLIGMANNKRISVIRFCTAIITMIVVITTTVSAQQLTAGASDQSSPVIINSPRVWEDITSVTIPDLDGAKAVMVISNFETRVAVGNRDISGNFRVADSNTGSQEITKDLIGRQYSDIGMGAANHIFTYPDTTGSVTFALQHKQSGGGSSRFASRGNMVAIVLDDTKAKLPYDIKTSATASTSSSTFVQIPGTITKSINLLFQGGIYLAASFTAKGNNDLTAEWVLRSSTDSVNFTEIPSTVYSSSVTSADGTGSIAIVLDNQPAGTYYFDVAQRTNTGNLTTTNLTLIAVGLVEANGNIYPAFSSTGGVALTTSASPVTAYSTGNIISENQDNSLFAHAVFNMSSTSVINPSGFAINVSNATFSPVVLNEYIDAGSTGIGGFVGLATGLTDGSNHQVSLVHYSDGSATLSTSNINISGFQLKSRPIIWGGSVDGDWNVASNWIPAVVPDTNNNVVIGTGSAIITPTGTGTCNNLVISGGAELTINSDASNSGSLIALDAVTGNVKYNRYLSGGMWHMVAAPVSGQDIWEYATNAVNNIAEKDTRRAITSYNEGLDTWDPYPDADPSMVFALGQGYSTLRTTSGTVSFYGSVLSADLNVPITHGAQVYNGWNLIGNPFTSAINATITADVLNNFLTVNSVSLDPNFAAIYLWDPVSSIYQTISNAGGTLPLHYIQAGQGFFVRSATGGGTISFTRSMQSHLSIVAYLKSLEKPWPSVRLLAINATDTINTVISFNNAMTTGLDVTYDAGSYRGTEDFALYTRLVDDNGLDFAIQALPSNIGDLEIQLGIEAPEGTEISLFAELENWPENSEMYLENRLTGEYIRVDSIGFNYSFMAGIQNTGLGNFYLHANVNTVGLQQVKNIYDEQYVIAMDRPNELIRILGETEPGARLRIYDLSGRMRMNSPMYPGNEHIINLSGYTDGVYVIYIQNGSKIITEKILW